ncbi:MAG: SUMF1/EgtB/PvdO family nonheme iron enzyme [Myxococcota bacterium]
MRRCCAAMALPGVLVVTLCACAERFVPPPEDAPTGITSVDGLPGAPCDGGTMVVVTHSVGGQFCIDRFEASLDGGALGNAMQGTDDTDDSLDGSTQAEARMHLGVVPRARVSWYQAKAACENAGKRLCTLTEWQSACRGPETWLYPYGDDVQDGRCNGFFNYDADKPAVTGAMRECGSAVGVYDMSGNVEEWTATAVARVPGAATLNDRAIRGGGFRANARSLSCVGEEFHASPSTSSDDRGFRCCAAAP